MTKTDLCRRAGGLLWLLLAPSLVAAQALPAPLDERTGITVAAPAATPDWQAMTPAQRADLRGRYRAWRGLDEAERARLRQAQVRLAALDPAQQQQLRERFAGMDRMYRDGWRLGPQLGGYYPRLQPLLGYVPAGQREALLTLLRSLDADQLQQLSVISQRTPPQDRDALRIELLAQVPSTRAQWLRHKLGR